jgi:hypothetical protein
MVQYHWHNFLIVYSVVETRNGWNRLVVVIPQAQFAIAESTNRIADVTFRPIFVPVLWGI